MVEEVKSCILKKNDWTDETFNTIQDCIIWKLDGADYDGGRIEDLERSVEKVTKYLANLTDLLNRKGVISQDEIQQLIEDIY